MRMIKRIVMRIIKRNSRKIAETGEDEDAVSAAVAHVRGSR